MQSADRRKRSDPPQRRQARPASISADYVELIRPSTSAITVALATAKMTANTESSCANARQPPPTASAARASSSPKPGSVQKSFISQVWIAPFVIRTPDPPRRGRPLPQRVGANPPFPEHAVVTRA
jgi:hypothetical protein